jgi:hypothetical protein
MTDVEIHGFCDERFDEIKQIFRDHFSKGLEVGASVAVTLNGKSVVDIWGGFKDQNMTKPWEEIFVYSTNPLLIDSDGDGYSDKTELTQGTDPNDIASTPGMFILLAILVVSSIIISTITGIIYSKRNFKRKPLTKIKPVSPSSVRKSSFSSYGSSSYNRPSYRTSSYGNSSYGSSNYGSSSYGNSSYNRPSYRTSSYGSSSTNRSSYGCSSYKKQDDFDKGDDFDNWFNDSPSNQSNTTKKVYNFCTICGGKIISKQCSICGKLYL